MAFPTIPINVGAFVSSTNVWDVNELYQTEVTSPAFKELLVRLYQNLNNMSVLLNMKDTGYYDQFEFVNSQLYFPNPAATPNSNQQVYRQVYRLTINFGALPNTAIKSVPHNLTPNSGWSFTRIYGTATDPVGFNYIPLPYAAILLANNIELYVDAVNVNISTAANYTAFTVTYVVLEYIKF